MSLEKALEIIEKKFGPETLMKYGDKPVVEIGVVSTGIPSLDKALGIGGFPKGRIVEIYGPESSGKTTLTLHVIAQAQKAGGTVAFVDAEHALDPEYASKLGVNMDEVLISQPDSGEQALEVVEALVRSEEVDVIIVDSVAALTPRAEIDGDMGNSNVGVQARLMSQAMRKLTAINSKNDCLIIFINQLRDKIGVMFGSPETTTGGKALKFYASVRIDIRRIGALKDGDAVIGNKTKIKIVKNKLAPPFKEVELDLIYGEGLSKEADLLNLAIQSGVIVKKGSWLIYKEKSLAQGIEKVRLMLKEEAFYDEIQKAIEDAKKDN